jgi:hypothetical protein
MKKHSLIFVMITVVTLIAIACNVSSTSPATSQVPQPEPPSATPDRIVPTPTVPPDGQPSLFKLVKSVDVTPVGNLAGGLFVRIGYVPGKDRIVVTFKAKLSQAEGDCTDIWATAYREYTEDMQEMENYGIITCQTGPDMGGMFLGDDYYYAAMGHDNANNMEGWYLAKYNAVTWKSSVSPFFYPLATEERNGDPMIAMVNGQIDISGKYKNTNDIGPGHATHHQLFTPDLQFTGKHVLTDAAHIDLTSLLVVNGVINFITSTDLWGDMIVMQYDTNWNYLGTKTLKQHASAPEGTAFDGTRFYVSYIDNSLSKPGMPGGSDNIRLAAFDLNWNLLDDIAVTSFVPDNHKAPARPSLTLHNNRVYVCYDQGENVLPDSNQPPENTDLQVHVKVYELTNSGH